MLSLKTINLHHEHFFSLQVFCSPCQTCTALPGMYSSSLCLIQHFISLDCKSYDLTLLLSLFELFDTCHIMTYISTSLSGSHSDVLHKMLSLIYFHLHYSFPLLNLLYYFIIPELLLLLFFLLASQHCRSGSVKAIKSLLLDQGFVAAGK